MLSASGRFAVPAKILNRSSFKTYALQAHKIWPREFQLNAILINDFSGDAADQTEDTRRCEATCPSSYEDNRTRECLADKSFVVRKPDSGSARQRWARENSKHRRTATRQRGS